MEQENIFGTLSRESRLIFQLIQKQETVTKKDLCEQTDNNITTLNRFFQPLEKAGLVIESGSADSCGGRRPTLYTVNPGQHYFGAVNISSTYYEVAIVNLKLQVMKLQHVRLTKQDQPDDVIKNIAAVLQAQCLEQGTTLAELHGVGIAVFSTFNHRLGKIGRPITLYLNEAWIGYSLEENLKQHLALPVVIENSTAAVAMLEYFYGVGKEADKMMYVLCSMNIRAMVMSQNQLLNDAMLYEDAFGHSTIDYDGPACSCGNFGCVNCYAAIPAILKQVDGNLKAGLASVLGGRESVSINDVCEAAAAGDTLCIQALTYAATMLGIGLANYINMVRPQMVVISGILVNQSDLYYQTCVSTVRQKLKHFIDGSQLTFLKNGKYSSPLITGAGSLMIENLLKSES